MATGCAAASAPPSTTNARIPTAVHLKTGRALQWNGVSAIRSALPQFPIDFKLAVRRENPHYGNAGILQEELPIFVPLLEQAGVTSFHVTLANHGALTDTIPPASHPFFSQEGCFLDFCDALRGLTALPLCGVGGLVHPSFIEEQFQKHRIDCAAMSRQLIADPDWVKKVREGRGGFHPLLYPL